MIEAVLPGSAGPGRRTARGVLTRSGGRYLVQGEEPEEGAEELWPAPDDEAFPDLVDEVALEGVLVGGGEESDDPAHNVALRRNGVPLEVFADLGVEEHQQSIKLIHFDLEGLELVGKYLLEPDLHQVLEHAVAVLLVAQLDVEVPSQVVHPLAVTDVLVEVGVSPQQRVQHRRTQGLPVQVQRSIHVQGYNLLHSRRHALLGHFMLHGDVVEPSVQGDQSHPLLIRRQVQASQYPFMNALQLPTDQSAV
jgi:hypothetical protein